MKRKLIFSVILKLFGPSSIVVSFAENPSKGRYEFTKKISRKEDFIVTYLYDSLEKMFNGFILIFKSWFTVWKAPL